MPDAATLELWRVAEDGDVEELAGLLRRVPDINACNEHGMTALMRAAQNGRVKMVRALLEHGADANLKRNDKFTALALAAFFGHTEVVRTLMEHGADLQASTRGGTSPQMWATARTFNEVVDQLEKPVAAPVVEPLATVREKPAAPVGRVTAAVIREAPAVIREAGAVKREGPLVVRTLKEPPEIWDLVHEAPRGFDARSAFLTRLRSMKTGFAFRAVAAVVLMGMCVVGVLVLRGVQARSERSVEPSQPSAASQPVTSKPVTAQPNNAAQPVVPVAPVASETITTPEAATQPVVPASVENNRPTVVTRKYSGARVVSSHRSARDVTPVAVEEAGPPVAAPVEKSTPPRVEPSGRPKATAPLSPQLITPAKSPTTKAKVIQWP
ncbi:MAG TPA: ankyrin repeat domain-containing protein [Pyrinomonadaceae bacterium]